jgi:Na+/melibiose symporter-like transporter
LWDFALQPRVVMLALLFTLAYTEFTAAAMLAPPGLTPVFVRLHLLSAHGPSAALSALLLAALLAPAALLALTFAAARFYARRDVR